MLVNLFRKTKTAGNIITPAEARAQCNIVGDTDFDAEINWFVERAQNALEIDGTITVCFLASTFECIIESKRTRLALPKSPIQSVESVEMRTLDGADWDVINDWNLEMGDEISYIILPASTINDPIQYRVNFTAGYDTVADIPAVAKQAVAVLTAAFFNDREAQTTDDLKTNPLAYQSVINLLRRGNL